MSLSDIMSALQLAHYPEIALVIFLGVFFAVTWRALRRPAGAIREAAMIPLDNGQPADAPPGDKS